MGMKEEIIEGQQPIFTREASPEEVPTEEQPMTNPKYRILTEDEILRLRRHQSFYWSERMKEESNLLYRVRCSGGKVTQSFIEGVIESLESAGDFQITSIGHIKFILFVAGNQPPIKRDNSKSCGRIISRQYDKALKRLDKNFVKVEPPAACYSYNYFRLGRKVRLSEVQKNTFRVTLKTNISFFMKTWGRE